MEAVLRAANHLKDIIGTMLNLRFLETGQIDVVMPVMNYADRHTYNFEGTVLPECRRQNVGAVAMKVYVGIKGGFKNHKKGHVGCVTTPDLLPKAMAYALDLEGISVVTAQFFLPLTGAPGIFGLNARAFVTRVAVTVSDVI